MPNKEKRAIIFHKEPHGPISWALQEEAERQKIKTFVYPNLTGLDEYDIAVYFHNRPELPKLDVKTKTGWWMCDLRPPSQLSIPSDHSFNRIFLCNKEYLKDYQVKFGVPVDYVPQCGYEFPRQWLEKVDWQVIFIGNFDSRWHQNRADILLRFQKEFKVNIITGEQTTLNQRWLYRHSPICLSISPQAEGYTSNRLYNILASQGFCLALYFKGIEELFKNHRDLVWFRDAEEGVRLARFYLNNDQRRREIARQGYLIYKKRHTARHRLEKMFNLLNN